MSLTLFTLISGLILSAGSVYAFVSILLKQNNEVEALSWMDGKEPEKSKFPIIQFSRPLVHTFTLNHVKRFKNEKYRKKVEKKILTAGLAKEINTEEFIGLQILWGIAFPALFFILNMVLFLGFPLVMIIFFSGIGFYFPHAYCNSNKAKRRSSIMTDLPVFIDVLALSTEAGLDFMGAIQKIAQKAPKNSILAEEFFIVLKDIKLGQSRVKALSSMDERNDIPELKSVLTVIKDADETGASISKSLKAKSEQIRFERFAKAEELAGKASQKILLPMVLFIVPAIFIIMLAPPAFQFLGVN